MINLLKAQDPALEMVQRREVLVRLSQNSSKWRFQAEKASIDECLEELL